MRFRQYISSVLVVVMLCMQGMVAHHYKAHVQGEQRISAYLRHSALGRFDKNPQHNTHNVADTLCEICLFAKHFSETNFAGAPAVSVVEALYSVTASQDSASVVLFEPSPYAARAPPAVIS